MLDERAGVRTVENITPLTVRESALAAKRVAAYARVSSGKDAMLHSLSAQVSHYSALIQKRRGWQYAGVYADEAISGTKNRRKGFQRMLDDCRAGKIDMILTKSISRFARNTVTTLQTIRELRALGVDVFFEEQNIHTLGCEGEVLLTLLAAYAQAEAESASENQKWRIKANYEKGLPWSVSMYGFRQVGHTLEVVPEEAEIIRLYADLYLEGCGDVLLARALEKAGVRGRRGGIMRANVLKGLIFNEKMVGDLLLQKTYIGDPIEKNVVLNRGERPQYYVQGSHEPILDRETWERILAERDRRADKFLPLESRGRKTYPFTGKITCGKCGARFRRKTVHDGDKCRVFWMCHTFNSKGKAHCNARQIPEGILKDAAASALGLPAFDGERFKEAVIEIRVPVAGALIFLMRGGSEIRVEWENKSRRHSWTPAMREKARADALRGHQMREGAIR